MDVVLGLFAATRPDERPTFVVDFEHVMLGAFAWVAEHALENHRDVAHEIDGIVVDDDVPRRGELIVRLGVRGVDDAGLCGRSHRVKHNKADSVCQSWSAAARRSFAV